MSDKETKEEMWKVKDDSGTVFGPASMASLQSWARDGRLAPTHMISSDGVNWQPVTSRRELAMDWIVELSPGKFYGPIHREACDELLANGTISSEQSQFARILVAGESPEVLKAENTALLSRMESLRSSFAAKIGELESQLSDASAELADLRAQLETRDLDFEAERQGLAASESKLKAELVKAEKKAAAAAARLEASTVREKSSAADRALIAELNVKLADAEESIKLQKKEFDKRSSTEKAEIRSLQARAVKAESELNEANALMKSLRVREDSLRKLVQQASLIFAGASSPSSDEEEIVIS